MIECPSYRMSILQLLVWLVIFVMIQSFAAFFFLNKNVKICLIIAELFRRNRLIELGCRFTSAFCQSTNQRVRIHKKHLSYPDQLHHLKKVRFLRIFCCRYVLVRLFLSLVNSFAKIKNYR